MSEQQQEPMLQEAFLRFRTTRNPEDFDDFATVAKDCGVLSGLLLRAGGRLGPAYARFAEEAVGTVITKLWAYALKPENADLRSVIAWLRTSVDKACIDIYRKESRVRPTDPQSDLDETPQGRHVPPVQSDPAELLNRQWTLNKHWTSVEDYCENKDIWVREIAILTYLEDLKPREIVPRLNAEDRYRAAHRREFTSSDVSKILYNMRSALGQQLHVHEDEE